MKHTFSSLLVLLLLSLPVFAQTVQPARTPFRVGIVGLVHGHVDGLFHDHLHNPEIQLVGIVEPNQQLFLQYSNHYGLDHGLWYSDLDKMLQKTNPQAVLVYTTTYDHRKVVETCARHGVHVMMEKPLAVSLEDALAIQQSASQGKIKVLVNYETTWYPSNHAAHDLLLQNAIGPIRKIVVHDGHQGPKEIDVGPEFLAWLTDPKLNGGGALFDFGCYGADLVTWLMEGRRPDSVTAITQHLKPDIYPRVDDEATIILTYPGAEAIIQASWNWPFGRKDMEVYGQTGYVITMANTDIRIRRADGKEEQNAAAPLVAPYDNSLDYFRAMIEGKAESDRLSSLGTNVIVTEILDAARKSATEGKTVRLASH